MSDWRPPSKYHPFVPPLPTASFAPRAVVGPLRSTYRLGTALLLLFAVDVAVLVCNVAYTMYARRVFEQAMASGFRPAALARLRAADSLGNGLFAVSLASAVAVLIVLPTWSYRVAANAKARGVLDVSPRLTAGGWFIPFANIVVPFIQLRRAARPFIGGTASITAWQVLASFSVLMQRSAGNDLEDSPTPEQYLEALSSHIVRQSV